MYFGFFLNIYLIDQTTTICGKPCRYSYMREETARAHIIEQFAKYLYFI